MKSLEDNGIPPNSNVYGGARHHLEAVAAGPRSSRPCAREVIQIRERKQRALGHRLHLVRQPARSDPGLPRFQIAPEYRERYGYPEITPALRAKVFGLNAAVLYGLDPQALPRARDRLAESKQAYAEDPEPSFATCGPRDADEFLALLALSQGKV